ncbi:MAG: Type 1 glutamine amidotransferase-like domain-containing protein [Candidatus Nanosyncoccaceae bacterium]|jgi:dipeptidase E
MKLLLTSAGLPNDTIKNSFLKLVDKPANEIKVAFMPTASHIEPGGKSWLIRDLNTLQEMGVAQIDIVDIAAITKDIWQPRLEAADVLFCDGGNVFFLLYWLRKSGLDKILSDLLKSRIWVGVSAGSMVPGQSVICDDEQKSAENVVSERISTKGLGLVNFSLSPHYSSPAFEDEDSVAKVANQLTEPMYAIDDETAIVVNGDSVKVVSEGKWKKFEN